MANLILFNDDTTFSKSKVDEETLIYSLKCPIGYSMILNKFVPYYGKTDDIVYMGVVVNIVPAKRLVHVLYKDFLLRDPIKISPTIKDMYMQTYIKKKYLGIKNHLISKMPRIKKLKRLNLKMIDREIATYVYTYLNDITDSYKYIYGYDASQRYKANLVTTPFYINDNGIIKIYKMDLNTLSIPEYDGANFLSYFSFQY